jgi:hypothetical protein
MKTQKLLTMLDNNINTLNQIADNCVKMESRQLVTLNKIRKMNGKQTVNSFEELRILKSKGL